MSKFNLFDLKATCTRCKKDAKAKTSYVHSWQVYCKDCYEHLVSEGKINPPIRYIREEL